MRRTPRGPGSPAARRVCRLVESHVPATVSPPGALHDALDHADVEWDASVFATLFATASLALGLVVCLAVVGTGGTTRNGLVAAVVVGGGTYLVAAYGLPRLVLTRRRARQFGALPGFVCRVTLGMRLTPTLERGVDAGFTTDDALTALVPRRPGADARSMLDTALGDLGPTGPRTNGLLQAATTATNPDVLLDRAVETTMDGVRTRMRTYASTLRGPVTAIYAFGVVLPLALVGVLPAAPLAGYNLSLVALAFVFDCVLPVGIVAGTCWLIARRPIVDPPPRLPATHPELGTRSATIASGVLGSSIGVALGHLLQPWAPWILGPAWGFGAALLVRFQPALPEIDRLRTTRDAVPDLLALLGDSMADGAPPERALTEAGRLPGTAGIVASDAEHVRHRLGIPVPTAIGGDHGPLADLDKRYTGPVTALVEAAGNAGRPGGDALSRYADHLDDLAELEASVRADLAAITDTLGQTAAFYAPAIGGVTVALATRLRDTSETLATTGDGFALVVGSYVLVLAVVLPVLAGTLQSGWCRVRIGASIGRTLVVAGGCFPLVAQFASHLL